MASKKRPTAKAAKPPRPAASSAKPKTAPAPAAARKTVARKGPARKADAATAAAAVAPEPERAARHDPQAFDGWAAGHLAAGPTLRSRARSSTRDADEGELDLAALTRPGSVLEVHFADGSTYYTVPADFLRRHVPEPPALRSGGPARLALPFDLGGRGARRSRSAATASAIERYAVSELTEPTTLDQLFDVAETFRQTARRWFGIGAGDARTPPLAAKLCAAFENAALHDAVGSGGGALLRWDADGWTPVSAPLVPRDGKVLLFLHGTASSTAGSFGKLWGKKTDGPIPKDFAPLAQSHLLLGWEHRSLTLSPIDNLIGLVDALLPRLPAGCTIDVVSHSRGGLVGELFALRSADAAARADAYKLFDTLFEQHPDGENVAPMFERLAAAGKAWAPGRFVRVACPARGTLLADGRTDLFLSLMLRALKLATSGVGDLVLGRVTALVKSLVATRADARALPGLEAMRPGSPLTRALARCEAQPADRLRVIAGDAAARGLSGLLTLAADVFYGWHDHDYVVHTRSMFGGLKRTAHAPLSLRWEHGSVSHFAYFAPEHPSRKALLATLAGQDDRYAPLADDERRTRGQRGVLQTLKADPLTRKLDFDHWRAGSNSNEQRRKPVLVVLAGIMGSELKRRSAPNDDPIWLTLGSMIGGQLDELELGRARKDPLVASGLLAVSYERLLERAQQSFSVLVFPFDWRAPIADSGAALAALLGNVDQALAPDNQVPVHLLVHSMGGLVARHALYIDTAGKALWNTLKQRDSRLVMLGTPNRGSYSPAQLLLRQHSLSKMLGLLARNVSGGDLSRFGAGFPGLMAMLPQEPDPAFGDLFEAAAWEKLAALDSGTVRPDTATLTAARDYVRGAAFQQSFDELVADAHAFYVAGSGDTALQMRLAPNPWDGFFGDGGGSPAAAIEFMAGHGGDGTVPWNSVLAPARTWYAPCEHGTLPDHTDSFEAYFELLTGGSTRRLPQQQPRRRGESDTAAPLVPLPLPPGPALLPASDAELADYLLQQVAQPVVEAQPDPIEVRMVHGGLDYARYPLIVSHYQHEPLAGAGKRVDEKLHGQLSHVLKLRLFVGAAMTAHYLRPNSHSAAEPPYRGALVLGLGSVGELTPGSLADTVTRGVLRYAFEHIHRDPYAPGPDRPVELRLSSLLVGVQASAFTVRDSLGGLLYGMWRAAQLLMRMGSRERPVRIRELEILEIDEHTALDAAYELQRLLQRGEWIDRLIWKRPVLEQREGAVSGYRPRGNRASWQRLVVRDDGHGGLAFSLIADRARVESTRVRADVQSLLQMIDRVSDDRAGPDDPIRSPTDPRFGSVLYQLLLPAELKSRLVNLDNTVLVVDDMTARYPWELLCPPLASAADGEEPRPFVVHAGMVRQRISDDRLPSLPVAPSGYHALIVGAPDTRGWRDERGSELQFTDLPGARAEAERVRDLLRADERWGGPTAPTELISLAPPADPRVRLSRWDAKSADHVRIALLERPYRLLHLCGHGVVDQWIRNDKDGKPIRKTGMLLSDQEILGEVDVEQMSVVPEFVFINCCYSGRDGREAATDGAGARRRAELAANLALAFIRLGSKAVVAAGWQVDDEAALQFAEAFYSSLLNGQPFGEAVRIARAAVHERHRGVSNTWGAYQCYGDPQWQLPGQALVSDEGSSRLLDACTCMSTGELAARVRQVLAVAGDKPPGEVLRQLDRLVSKLEADPLRHGWMADSQVRAALGMAYRELDDHEKAARHLQSGARTAGSEVQIGQLELLMNSLTRVRGEHGDMARAASKQLLKLLNDIADNAEARWPLTDAELPIPAARSERHCLLGGEYLREAAAQLERLEPDDEGRLAPTNEDRRVIATAFERATIEFVQGYGDKCKEGDKADRRSYALSNALLATALGALFGQPDAALRALGALPGPAASARERTAGTPQRWLREVQLLMNELTVADDQATFWHQSALLELQLARGLFRNAYYKQLSKQPDAEDVAPVRRMIDEVLARWPSPVQLDSLRHRFRLLRFVMLCPPGLRGKQAEAMQGLRLELKKLCDEALDHKLTQPQARNL